MSAEPRAPAPLLGGGGSGPADRSARSWRSARSARRRQEGLGTNYLGSGLNGIAAAILTFQLLIFLSTSTRYSDVAPAATAWVLVILAFGSIVLAIRLSGRRLPLAVYLCFLLAVGVAVVLDLVAVIDSGSARTVPTAAVAAAVAHAALIVHRRGVEILAVGVLVSIAEVVVFLSMESGGADVLSVRISALVVTLAPAVVVVVMMRGFRRMVQLETDRALVQSTTLGPRYAVGMLASEELARLDLAAERLLAEVGDGSVRLPLDAQRAAHATSLATQLRLHLIEGRRETWLHHAVLESELLSPLVDLDDPDGTAGLLGHDQRDGLLSAIWLIADSATGLAVVLHVESGSPRDSGAETTTRGLLVPIVLYSSGAPLRVVDPATWEAIAQVGVFRDTSRDGELRIEIDCLVDNPADR
ncbi:hypothetical protein C5C18_05075 [Rathayibacter tritici]|uniref:Uncharacterized protein n=1 Tax=Rathayibacter tritici TaxID=33888 RepID=A0A160KT80_9MICO|nr:hypothetical protein [Rathayibacter tritici]AND16990.1 hypothetical protein A6122_1862 [Rathayibacter tritici]PPF69310.1 hypothetical protein C5C21_02700 [Rathayibacter tritici]PPG08319.1 hypothetical protein C5C18_05075 [Rathayibacter tritici]PPI43691.1 hypothetical protein C5D18_08460 [Rathayibacter tritici]